jgi:hypothetical protein
MYSKKKTVVLSPEKLSTEEPTLLYKLLDIKPSHLNPVYRGTRAPIDYQSFDTDSKPRRSYPIQYGYTRSPQETNNLIQLEMNLVPLSVSNLEQTFDSTNEMSSKLPESTPTKVTRCF